MSFFEKSANGGNFKKTEYLKLTPGTHTIRIIEDAGRKYYQHWMGSGVECLGEDCPQCKLNRQIMDDIGGNYETAYKEAKKVEGFSPRQPRGAVNVLDRTPVKICANCGHENRPVSNVFPAACSECGQAILDIKPRVTNKIKVFSRAATVFEQIDDLDKSVLDEEKEPIGVRNFDITLHVVGNQTVPVPSDNYDEVEFDEDDLFDLDRVALKLSAEEMEKKMKGASFSEIFKARSNAKEAETESVVQPSEEQVTEIQSEIEDLF
jgi:DNA-directed RNA polymerase subunit RPC12/RpoP